MGMEIHHFPTVTIGPNSELKLLDTNGNCGQTLESKFGRFGHPGVKKCEFA